MIRSTNQPVIPSADESEYHALGQQFERGDKRRVMSRSQLALFDECPSEWMNGAEVKSTKAMDWGSLMDARVTNPKLLEKYIVAPRTYFGPSSTRKDSPVTDKPWNMNATFCKEWWSDQEAHGRIPVKSEIWEASKLATVALSKDKIAGPFIRSCKFQVQVLVEWVDDVTGIVVPLKCLIDLAPYRHIAGAEIVSRLARHLGDFKTCNDVSAQAWTRKVFDEGYHTQGALYLDAWNAATGDNRDTFVHIIQKPNAPYQTARRMLDEEFLELGKLTYEKQLRRYCQCLQTGAWPDYDSDRQEFGELVDGFRLVSPMPWMIGA